MATTRNAAVTAVERALRILDAFAADEQGLSLAELSRRLAMEKSTVLRTARTLAVTGYLARSKDQRWRLGPAAGWLGVRYQASFDVRNLLDAVLRRLAQATGETAAIFVPEDGGRTCIARIDRPSLERHHIRVGEKLPMARGASGRILLAFGGAEGERHAKVRRIGHYVSVGERDLGMSSIAVPVWRGHAQLFGALCISGTAGRLDRGALMAQLPALHQAAAELGQAAEWPPRQAPEGVQQAQWHP